MATTVLIKKQESWFIITKQNNSLHCTLAEAHELSWEWFNVPLNAVQVIPETMFPASLLTGTKHPGFSADELADSDNRRQQKT